MNNYTFVSLFLYKRVTQVCAFTQEEKRRIVEQDRKRKNKEDKKKILKEKREREGKQKKEEEERSTKEATKKHREYDSTLSYQFIF